MALDDLLRAQREETKRWIEARNREVLGGLTALEDRGREILAKADLAGAPLQARTYGELRDLARLEAANRTREKRPAQPAPVTSPQPPRSATPVRGLSFGPATRQPAPRAAVTAPQLSPEIVELRRQQEAFRKVRRDLDVENSWMAAIALAPLTVVGGLEAIPFAIAKEITPGAEGLPLSFPKKERFRLRGGDTHEARIGRRAHEHYKQQAKSKPGWTPNPRFEDRDGSLKIPDLEAPAREGRTTKRLVDVKPDTPSGRRAGAKLQAKYGEHGKVRPLFYDPKRFR